MKRQEYDHSKLKGMDVCIEISLKEYELAWIETEKDYLFYYGVKGDGAECKLFDFATIDKGINIREEYNWVNWNDMKSYSETDPENDPIPIVISDLLSYYGYENVFGSFTWEGLSFNDIVLNEVNKAIDTFNEYSDEGKMELLIEDDEAWFTLYINDREITEGDADMLLTRINQINRERGFSFL